MEEYHIFILHWFNYNVVIIGIKKSQIEEYKKLDRKKGLVEIQLHDDDTKIW